MTWLTFKGENNSFFKYLADKIDGQILRRNIQQQHPQIESIPVNLIHKRPYKHWSVYTGRIKLYIDRVKCNYFYYNVSLASDASNSAILK